MTTNGPVFTKSASGRGSRVRARTSSSACAPSRSLRSASVVAAAAVFEKGRPARLTLGLGGRREARARAGRRERDRAEEAKWVPNTAPRRGRSAETSPCCAAARRKMRSLGLRRHFHEGKATGTAGIAIGHHRSRFDRADFGKEPLEIIFGRAERKITNIKFHGHSDIPIPSGMLKKLRIRCAFGERPQRRGLIGRSKKNGF